VPDPSLILRLPVVGLVSKVPGIVLGRFYPTAKAAERFHVDLRSLRGFSVVHSAIPEVELYLRFVNLNPFPVTVYRVDFPDIWFGQPIVKDQQRLVDFKIPAVSVRPPFRYHRNQMTMYDEQHRFTFQLDGGKMDYIKLQMRDGKLQSDPTVSMDIYAKSGVGDFVKKDVYLQIPREQVGGL
jgi:hypothetical protein